MSHFITAVILPKDTKTEDIEGCIGKLLAPYDENLEVPEHDTDCYCVGSVARQAARDAANEQAGSLEDLRTSYHAMPDDQRPEWREHIAEYIRAEQAVLHTHPKEHDPLPDCADCKGTGKYKTTNNPRSKWDWWRVGGRWDGKICNNPQQSQNGFNFGEKHESVVNNMVLARNLPEDFDPFAVVTPDGMWHECGEMGWWGCVSKERSEESWVVQVKKIFADHAEHFIVACDLHI